MPEHRYLFRAGIPALTIGTFMLASGGSAMGQSTFQNLDFEAARIILISPSEIATSNALPGWSASVPFVFYDTISIGAEAISVHDQNSDRKPLLGNYSVFLQGSFPPTDYAYIWQTGTIPADAKSLEFLSNDAGTPARIHASFAGEEIPLTTLEPQFPYGIGGDIAKFAGQTGELRFWGGAMLDSISFSPQTIPEPSFSTLVTAALGLYAIWAMRRRTSTNCLLSWNASRVRK